MANEKNLKPVRSKSEATERGRKGGINSGQSRRNKALLRDCFEALLESKNEIETDKGIMKLTGAEAVAFIAFQKALGGDIKAMEFIRDTSGQKPVDKVMIADVEPSVIAEVEAMVTGETD